MKPRQIAAHLFFAIMPSFLTMASNLPLILEVALVGHDNDGKVVLVFDPENLLMEC